MSNSHPETKSWTNQEKAQWFEDNSSLIWHCVKKFLGYFSEIPSIDPNDLYQIAAIAVLSAFDHYTPNNEVKFSTYATICMENALKMYVRSEFAEKRPKQITSMDDERTENLLQNEVVHTSLEDHYVFQEMLENVYAYIEKKVGKDADVIFTVLCKEMSQSNAASLIHCSQASISQNVKKIRKELQSEFKGTSE